MSINLIEFIWGVAIVFVLGVSVGMVNIENNIHTEKHGCEYVEKAECKQVWVRK